MSLMRQLWLTVILTTLLAFVGSMGISIWSARDYLATQLARKNSDNATSLALSMTQLEKDAVTVELQVAALFDTGYYQKVSVVAPGGQVISERVQEKSDVRVPAWFKELFPIRSVPGVAQVNDGWKQFGVVTVISHSEFAHRALWEQSGTFMLWFLLGGLLVGALGMLGLRAIGRSLGYVVDQAAAIGERRFIAIPEPRPQELRAVSRAMNAMVERIKAMFEEEATRLETLRKRVNHDAVTGLASRDYFMAHVRASVASEQSDAHGALVMVRIADFAHANVRLGHQRVDVMLAELGKVLYDSGNDRLGQRAGRLNGGDFAVLCPGLDDPAAAARDIHERLMLHWMPRWVGEQPDLFHVAGVGYQRNQGIGELLAQADETLARTQASGQNNWLAAHDSGKGGMTAIPAEQWRDVLAGALKQDQVSLAFYPVRARDGSLLHQEGVIRLRAVRDGAALCAGDFMPMAAKLNLTALIDLRVVSLAIEAAQETGGKIAVNLSDETIADFGFRHQLTQLLKQSPGLLPKLLFEVPEYGVFRHFDAFCELSNSLKSLGCHVGIEYFGQRFAESGKLTELGLDYIKTHPSYVHDIANNPGNQEFLQGLCRIAHALGIEVVAVGVEKPEDVELLVRLGFDGVTGVAIR